MGDMIVPLLVVVIAALAVIGIFIISRYPVSTWRAGLRGLTKAARDKEGPVEVVPQDVHLDDLMTRDDSSAYTRPVDGLRRRARGGVRCPPPTGSGMMGPWIPG